MTTILLRQCISRRTLDVRIELLKNPATVGVRQIIVFLAHEPLAPPLEVLDRPIPGPSPHPESLGHIAYECLRVVKHILVAHDTVMAHTRLQRQPIAQFARSKRSPVEGSRSCIISVPTRGSPCSRSMSRPHSHHHGSRKNSASERSRSEWPACHGLRCRLRTQSKGSRTTTTNAQSGAPSSIVCAKPCFQPKRSVNCRRGRLRRSNWATKFVPEQRSPKIWSCVGAGCRMRQWDCRAIRPWIAVATKPRIATTTIGLAGAAAFWDLTARVCTALPSGRSKHHERL